ncbi:hypothetical protein PHYBOEH_007176 [Phytophthora boehmeriae]|uniref:Ubiquitin-like domain-containing protein n=1 Tax=Phytophthora boehmeriae TaxID=109152 RepID=A0A8T1WEF7_9STRA|nr:hypothetical protein PHYBOEH_007176 [Phytophthora boehmeriae]
MSDSDGDDIKLYSALERNQKRQRQIFVAFSSSSEDEDDGFSDFSVSTPVKKRRRGKPSPSRATPEKTKSPVRAVNLLDDEDEDDDDLYTESEREAERLRKARVQREIRLQLAQDKVLNQTRAVFDRVSSAKNQVILLDSSEEEDSAESAGDGDVAVVDPVPVVAPAPIQPVANKGPRITLHVRSNGGAVDEIPIYMKESFASLYTSFCELHGLPQSAVKMLLDGEALSLTDTPANNDLEAGDLIDAKVDFSKQNQAKKKTYLRLRLVVFGKRSEVFKIDASETIEKLHTSYCKRHGIQNPDDVVMSVQGRELSLNERIDYYGLIDSDEIAVKINNFVDPQAIEVQLRYTDGASEAYRVLPQTKVQELLARVAKAKGVEISKVSLIIDGEQMVASQTFKSYDVEGGELIEVKLSS